MRSLIIVTLAKYKWNDETKENAIGKTNSTNDEEEKCIQDIPLNPEGKCPLGRHRRRWVCNILEG
jgi:hypothetical protein